jgi:hypothetical protein
MGTHLCRITSAGGGEFLENGVWLSAEPVYKIMVEAANSQRLHPTSILNIQSI